MASPSGHFRPGRHLAAFLGVVAFLYALVFFTGDGEPKPKLGIDLEGGTRVVLTARTPEGDSPSKSSLDQAKDIIEDRVNGRGVNGAEVVRDGSNLVITAPGDDGGQIRQLAQTAKLYFRPVVGQPIPATTIIPADQPPTEGDPAGPPAPGATGTTEPPAPAETSTPAPVSPQAAQPSTSPTPPTEPAPPADEGPNTGTELDEGPSREQIAAEIRKAQETRQSADPTVQQTALAALDCSKPDPLRGNEDPTKPLVTCGIEEKPEENAKYVLGPSFMSGEEISDADAGIPPGSASYQVQLDFDGRGSSIWANYTADHVGEMVAFTLDGKVVSAPRINDVIAGGTTTITGNFSRGEANDLADALKYGSLPLSFETSEAQTVSATLGAQSLKAGLIAGAIGLAVVFVYCLFYYRLLGLLTILSLVLSGVIVYAVLVLFGRWIDFTLDLPGIAGFIVAIGITADSFVIYFERLKDEVREGRTFRSAVPRGWIRARRTILSADAVSFLGAAVLYLLAIGQVKGFAFTLGMSTVLDLVVVFLVTHPLVALASKSPTLSHHRYTGLGKVAAVAEPPEPVPAAGGSR